MTKTKDQKQKIRENIVDVVMAKHDLETIKSIREAFLEVIKMTEENFTKTKDQKMMFKEMDDYKFGSKVYFIFGVNDELSQLPYKVFSGIIVRADKSGKHMNRNVKAVRSWRFRHYPNSGSHAFISCLFDNREDAKMINLIINKKRLSADDREKIVEFIKNLK